MGSAAESGSLLLVVATANQVNQFGGYTGQTPAQFRQFASKLEAAYRLVPGQLVLGGDHLGPVVWQNEPAAAAMAKANQMVSDYVLAGFTKIHLDASMPLGGDPPGGLPPQISAERTAHLCRQAETAYRQLPPGAPPPFYVIGTEVPPPGGETSSSTGLEVTTVESARHTLELIQGAFIKAGLENAWKRVTALVVQPGVEYGNRSIHEYQREKARQLSRFIETRSGLVYEAHSTDYQTPEALHAMVEDHFAILKVGPALTFAYREAIFALGMIELELGGKFEPGPLSHIQEVLDEVMVAQPGHWERYYTGKPEDQKYLRRFSFSDRSRYYWNHPRVSSALDQLFINLNSVEIPPELVSQFLPSQYQHCRQGSLNLKPEALVMDKIKEIIGIYGRACRPLPE